jgi:hypothetical protein
MPLLTIFGELEKLLADLYPYRYPISALLLGAALIAAYLAWRLRLQALVWRHRVLSLAVGAPLLAISLVAGDYLLSPLWERSFLEEASPLAPVEAAAPPANASPAPLPSAAGVQPSVLRRGQFKGADEFHFGRGDALLIRAQDGGLVLRFEAFSVRNGPDLHVYLSRDTAGSRVDEGLNLGRLKATDGAFNYEVPASIDVSTVRSVVVWCRQFGVLFALAPLDANR